MTVQKEPIFDVIGESRGACVYRTAHGFHIEYFEKINGKMESTGGTTIPEFEVEGITDGREYASLKAIAYVSMLDHLI